MSFLDYIDEYTKENIQESKQKLDIKPKEAKIVKKFVIPKKIKTVSEDVNVINHAVQILEGINEEPLNNIDEKNINRSDDKIQEITNHASDLL
jgi:hypothetical protein